MNLLEYQKFTVTTAIYPCKDAIEYLVLGLCSESGEVAGKVKKVIRDAKRDDDESLVNFLNENPQFKEPIVDELSDCLWYIARLCFHLDIDIETLAQINHGKLSSRKERGAIGGSGDKR